MKIRKSEIKQKVNRITCDQLCLGSIRYEDNKHLRWAELGADSLDMVELVMLFENEFNCEISDSEAIMIRTPKQAIDYLYKQFNK